MSTRFNFENTPACLQPLPSLAIGFALCPLTWLSFVPAYVFAFLLTLVHECGHAIVAWFFGMPAIPAVGLQGGGVTALFARVPLICFAVMGVFVWLAWGYRNEFPKACGWAIGAVIYAFVAFSSLALDLVTAGGIAFEIGGAIACFYWVLAAPVTHAVERSLYALWGAWMMLYRAGNAFSMLREPSLWEENLVANGGVGEGLANDLPRLCEAFHVAPPVVLSFVLFLCLCALPLAFVLAIWRPRHRTIFTR